MTLRGTADSVVGKSLADRLAQSTRGVKDVDNQLVVKPAVADAAKSSEKNAGVSLSDRWITTNVMSTFLYSCDVSGSDIGASAKNGMVTPTGKVKNRSERALATDLVQNVRGVKGVRCYSSETGTVCFRHGREKQPAGIRKR